MSKEPLKTPVVTCSLGLLYNKESVINNLIEKTIPKAFKHIHSLKDVITINFKPNPKYNPNGEKDHHSVTITDWTEEAPFICPITNVEVGGSQRFSVLKSCGCAFSDRALRECPSEVCLVCNTPFTSQDVLPLNPDDEELKELRVKLKEKIKQEKKEKKERQEAAKKVKFASDIGDTPKIKKRKAEKDATKGQIVSGSEDITLKKQKKVKSTTTVQAPANATPSVYASLFTSSIKEPQIKESFVCRNVARG